MCKILRLFLFVKSSTSERKQNYKLTYNTSIQRPGRCMDVCWIISLYSNLFIYLFVFKLEFPAVTLLKTTDATNTSALISFAITKYSSLYESVTIL